MSLQRLGDFLSGIDRRVIYLLVIISLTVPLILKTTLPPAQMHSADLFYKAVDTLQAQPGKLVLIAADWGPNVQAENESQTQVAIEHLMRKRIPFAMISTYILAGPFLEKTPLEVATKLEHEIPGEKWVYGKDWVNLGYQFGGGLRIQQLAKADDIQAVLKADAYGTPLDVIPCMKGIHTIRNVMMLMEFTGLVGAFNVWVQLFQVDGYRPPMVHGCTSITIPEAHIYLASKQIIGLFEGIAGAAWYDKLLTDHYPNRKDGKAMVINTSLAFAHLMIIGLIIFGNIGLFLKQSCFGTEPCPKTKALSVLWRKIIAVIVAVLAIYFVNSRDRSYSYVIENLTMFFEHLPTNVFQITWWEIFLGGITTLSIYSFLYRENSLFRFFEHLFIGIATGYGILQTIKTSLWQQILKSVCGADRLPFPDGTYAEPYNKLYLLYLLPAAFGLLYYFILSRRHNWLAQLTIGFSLGSSAGLTFKSFFNEVLPQVYDSFRPLYLKDDLYTSVGNIVFTITLVSTMTYFFFTFKRKERGALQFTAATGRWMMMVCFGAFFGSTVMARMALLVERLQFLIDKWWPNFFS